MKHQILITEGYINCTQTKTYAYTLREAIAFLKDADLHTYNFDGISGFESDPDVDGDVFILTIECPTDRFLARKLADKYKKGQIL